MMPIDASQDLITSSQQPLPFRLFSWRRRLALLPASQRQSALEEMLFQLGTRCDVHTTSGTFSAVVRWRSVGIELVNHEGNHDDGGIGSTFDALMLEFGSIHAVSLERYSMNSSPTPSLHRASDIDPSPSASSEDDEGGIRAYFCVEASAESHHLSDLPPTTEMFLIHPLAMRTSADEQRIRQHAAYLDQLDGVAYHAAWEGTSNSEAWASKVEEQLNLNRRAVAQRAEAAVDGANLPAAQSHSPPPHYPPPQDDDETVLLEAQVRELQQVLQTKELLLSELERQLRVASAEQRQQQRPPIIINTSAAQAGMTDSIPLVFDDLETFDSDLALATEGAGESPSAAMQSNTRRPRTAGGVLLHPDAQLADTALATLPDRPSYSPQSDEDVNEHHDERNNNDHCQNRSAAFPGATAESQSSSTHRPATAGGSAAVITSVRFADVLLIDEEPEGSTAQPVLVPPNNTSYQNYFQPSSRTSAHADDASAPETVTAAAAHYPHPDHLQGVSPIRRHHDATADMSSSSPLSLSTPSSRSGKRSAAQHQREDNNSASSQSRDVAPFQLQQQRRAPPTRGMVVRPSSSAAAAAPGLVDQSLTPSVMHFLTEFTGRGSGGGASSRQRLQQQQHRTQHQGVPNAREQLQLHQQRPQQGRAGNRRPPAAAAAAAAAAQPSSGGGSATSRQLGLGSLGDAVLHRSEVAHDAQLLQAFDDIHGGGSSSSSSDDDSDD